MITLNKQVVFVGKCELMQAMSYVYIILAYVAKYFIYKKMGREGWEAIIPIYDDYVLFEELYGNGWKFLLLLIPVYGIYVTCKMYIDLAHKFNKSTGFGWGLILVNIIFECILAFDNSIQCDNSTYNIDFDEANPFNSSKTKTAESEAEALLKFKELLDAGAITEEEYETKKKEILGL